MSWITVTINPREIHVMPCTEDGDVARNHEPRPDCPACRPMLIRDGPLDDPIWSHDEPTWPGSIDRPERRPA